MPETKTLPIALDAERIYHCMYITIPSWLDGYLRSPVLDVIHQASGSEMYDLMLPYPNTVMAYVLYQMKRTSSVLDELYSINKKGIDDLMKMLDKIRNEEREEAGDAEQDGQEQTRRKGRSARAAVH